MNTLWGWQSLRLWLYLPGSHLSQSSKPGCYSTKLSAEGFRFNEFWLVARRTSKTTHAASSLQGDEKERVEEETRVVEGFSDEREKSINVNAAWLSSVVVSLSPPAPDDSCLAGYGKYQVFLIFVKSHAMVKRNASIRCFTYPCYLCVLSSAMWYKNVYPLDIILSLSTYIQKENITFL